MDAPRMKTIATLRAEDALARRVRGDRKTDVELRSALQVAKVVRDQDVVYVFVIPVTGVAEVARKCPEPARVAGTGNAETNKLETNNVATDNVEAGNVETNTVVNAQPDGPKPPDGSLLKLLDEVERNPESVACRLPLAEAYFSAGFYDEATGECRWIVDRLDSEKELQERDVDALARAAEILFSLGEYRLSRKAFARVRDVPGSRYHSRALQALSEIQLKIGLD